MEQLILSLKITMANKFLMYFKAHTYHWNVEGLMFPMFHDFFGKIYEDVYSSVDTTAEELRAMGEYAPVSLEQLYSFATIKEDTDVPASPLGMLRNLQTANEEVLDSLNKVFDLATAEKQQGLADFVAGRIDTHKKHGWMISSTLKNLGE
jgi:starvation-inducible DNA-binding protein